MLNWSFFSLRNFVVIGLIALIWTVLAARLSRTVQNGSGAK